jgi:DNA-binding MarR family transcriptional regulator
MFGKTETRQDQAKANAAEVIHQMLGLAIEIEVMAARFADAAGLHLTDVRALRLLHTAGAPLGAGELGRLLYLSSGSTTHLIDRLEQAGHVERVRDRGDRRRVLLQPSAKALALADEFFGAVEARTSVALGDASATDLAGTLRVLRSLAGATRADDRQ